MNLPSGNNVPTSLPQTVISNLGSTDSHCSNCQGIYFP